MFLFKALIRLIFRISGWQVKGKIPEGINKAVLVGAPHTSNWDLFYTLGLMYTLNLKFRFLIKKEALVFPLKSLLLAFGAYPINRGKGGENYVEQIVRVFEETEECFLCIAPEGTRKPVSHWKSGFYHIAQKARVPILVGYLDCKEKIVHVGHVLDSNLTESETMKSLKEHLKKAVPKRPSNFAM